MNIHNQQELIKEVYEELSSENFIMAEDEVEFLYAEFCRKHGSIQLGRYFYE